MLPLALGDRVVLLNGQRGTILALEDVSGSPTGWPQRVTVQLENGLSSVFSSRMLHRVETPDA